MKPDILYSMSLLLPVIEATGNSDDLTISFRHDGPPKSKARPRVVNRYGRSMAFTPKESREAEARLAAAWRSVLKGATLDGTLAIACVFFRPNHQRIDADNMVKLVLDAGTKAKAWHDDSQIVTIVARIEYDKEFPRTEVTLMPTQSTLRRDSKQTRQCEHCGKDFKFHPQQSRSTGRFCSGACAQTAKRVVARCARCDADFLRKKAGAKFCSKECAAIVTAETRRQSGRTPPVCEVCGERVSRREYKQCAKCRGYGRPRQGDLPLEAA